ncbi:MAG: SMP-30/gluconolactonase/LRE family protein [Pseudomonadota bacterium]
MGCAAPEVETDTSFEATDQAETLFVQMIDSRLSDLIDPDAKPEILSDGYLWSEGPTWDRERSQLYFTDVPGNKAYVWKESEGTSVFLDPSGSPAAEGFREPGANGLFYIGAGQLVLGNHGTRAVERLNIEYLSRTTIVNEFDGQRFNSPNDLVQAANGDIYFSDPPYGLEGLNDSPLKELDFNGVYRHSSDGVTELLTDQMTFPNGVILSRDETRLYVAQSDPNAAGVFVIDLDDADPSEPRLFFDMQPFLTDNPGLPDGFAMAETGEIFVTGPGGVFILSETGELLGRIFTGSATANVTFGGDDGRMLFITAQDRLIRLPTRVRGAAWN